MATFSEANRVRLSLKMKLSQYWWYGSSTIISEQGDYTISVSVKKIDNQVRKSVPQVFEGVSVRMSLE